MKGPSQTSEEFLIRDLLDTSQYQRYELCVIEARRLAVEFVQTQMDIKEPEKFEQNANHEPVIINNENGSKALIALQMALHKDIVTNAEIIKRINDCKAANAKLEFMASTMLPTLAKTSSLIMFSCFLASVIKTYINPCLSSHTSLLNTVIVLSIGFGMLEMCKTCTLPLSAAVEANNDALRIDLKARIHDVLLTTFAKTELAKELGSNIRVI